MKLMFTIVVLLSCFKVWSQPYTSYFTGSKEDVQAETTFGICLMGGASENDEGMKWLLSRSGGGDIVVIRASGSDGYNAYLFSELGITVNSVETLLIDSEQAASDPYVEQQLRNAEMIWIAGGNQGSYVAYWRDSPVEDAINDHINIKKAPIGGTSAGMAILGQAYFTAQSGTIRSGEALSNPLSATITLGYDDFIQAQYLQNVVTDTHYDNPDRRGRHTVFLASLFRNYSKPFYGIAAEEYTAICIDESGKARVFGGQPEFDDNAYFLQIACENNNGPEVMNSSEPLTWSMNKRAVSAYVVEGTPDGKNSFDLSSWSEGTGGKWQNWYVENGVFGTSPSQGPCLVTGFLDEMIQPLPVLKTRGQSIYISHNKKFDIEIFSLEGVLVYQALEQPSRIKTPQLKEGIYIVNVSTETDAVVKKVLIH